MQSPTPARRALTAHARYLSLRSAHRRLRRSGFERWWYAGRAWPCSSRSSPDLPPKGASRESGTFDFKGAQNPKEHRELAKDVAAFANALGGVVLVGAQEDKKNRTLGIYTPIKTVEEAEALRAAYELAVTQKCVPQPVIAAVTIETIAGVHPPGHVVAINVNAAPMGPIGVRWDGAESFAFPLRTETQTYWMTPTEVAMLMVPEIRRVATMLDSIPEGDRFEFRIYFHGNGRLGQQEVRLLGVDPLLTTVRFLWSATVTSRELMGAIPLDRVRSVWRRDDRHWNMDIDGNMAFGPNEISFLPI